MTAPPNVSDLPDRLAEQLTDAGQAHLIRVAGMLGADQRGRFVAELASIDWRTVGELRDRVLEAAPRPDSSREVSPPEVFPLERTAEQTRHAAQAVAEGEQLLAAGRVACLVVAGGQASRLGLHGPKGTVPAGPVSGRSLFEIFALKLRAAHERYGQPVPFYVMTSPANDAETRAFISEHDCFGLDPADVFFFTQGVLPALDESGRALLASPGALALAPTGHGGVFSAMRDGGVLDDLLRRKIELVSYFQVDNPLVLATDPLFLGLHSLARAGMSSKVVRRSADEKVGVIAIIDGRHGCIEYSNLPDDLRRATNEDGSLRYSAGSIAMHVISVDFAANTVGGSDGLSWTLAHKRMKVVDEAGNPGEQMAYKAERFVFDALRFSDATVTLEVDRSVEFSPIKNAEGENSPATSRADMCALHGRWVAAAGLPLPPAGEDGVAPVEIDPRIAVTQAEFVAKAPLEPLIVEGGHLYTPAD
ncbi:MAG TPA: UTP--glucose-1-phosphate uridylyltransferase [Acidimicrobiia bacterium]|jgi:UDP-N-acetylglucosamine/UDP-N-acetylgalactosamine diphosphorylase|nr:UTP--glucose-1-phosphate uridylyltransferase [Acidimicrobiia bacterium]